MANNRLFLVHRPTGLAVFLGKRMLRGWYAIREDNPLNDFFDRIDALYGAAPSNWREPHNPDNLAKAMLGQDDFLLVLEDNTHAPHIAELTWYEGDSANLIVRFTHASSEIK